MKSIMKSLHREETKVAHKFLKLVNYLISLKKLRKTLKPVSREITFWDFPTKLVQKIIINPLIKCYRELL